jgi:hypothetical protein
MSLEQILERQDDQSTELVGLAKHFALLAEKAQKDLDAANARIAQLHKAYQCDGCLCSLFDELRAKNRELEQQLLDAPCKSYDEEFC